MSSAFNKKTALIILDGWGLGPADKRNAVTCARTPFMDSLLRNYPNTQLNTSGEDVGLPVGQMGNSEVGHLNLGAGRIVWQELANINKAIREKTIDQHPALTDAFKKAVSQNCNLHFMGLVSDGGVHSHVEHLKHLCTMASNAGLEKVYVHAFTDGRDTDPKSSINYLKDLENHMNETCGKISTIVGRYYAMDRDKRWDRVRVAYDAIVNRKGHITGEWQNSIESSYAEGITDEFIKPIIVCDDKQQALPGISEGDIVLCFNFRTDRCREITEVLTQHDMPEFGMKRIPLHYLTMTRYDSNYHNITVVYEKDNLAMTLGEIIEKQGLRQLRIAETEKYPHVTYFFSGGREQEFDGESRIMIPSPKVATYDLKPEMSANEVCDAAVSEMSKGIHDFICLNFANADMVGHTGNFAAAVKAVEIVDNCLASVVESGLENGYSLLIIADHGNADTMINQDGSPNTAHTTNPVPCIFVSRYADYSLSSGRLADVAPTLLGFMNIPIPSEMSGKNLLHLTARQV